MHLRNSLTQVGLADTYGRKRSVKDIDLWPSTTYIHGGTYLVLSHVGTYLVLSTTKAQNAFVFEKIGNEWVRDTGILVM